MEHNSHRDSKSFLSNDYRSSGKQFSHDSRQRRKAQEEEYLSKKLDYRNFVFAPEGYEAPVIFLYILTIPYFMGLGFLFLFIARASYEYFLDFNLASFIVIWAIGYEVTAVLLLIGIFLGWLNHHNNRFNREKERERHKSKARY